MFVLSPQSSNAVARDLSVQQALKALAQVQRGSVGQVLNLIIRTKTAFLPLQSLQSKAVPFYTLAAQAPFSFLALLDLVSGLGDQMVKSWLLAGEGQREGFVVTRELAVSRVGLAVDGLVFSQEGLPAAVSRARQFVERWGSGFQYYLGQTAGIVTIGKPENLPAGVESCLASIDSCQESAGNEVQTPISGAVTAARFNPIAHQLLQSEIFLSLDMIQPALTSLIKRLVVYRDGTNGRLNCECQIALVSQAIQTALIRTLNQAVS